MKKDQGGTVLSQSQYRYDPKNRRVAKTVNSTTTYTLYDNDSPWADYDSTLQPTTRYLHGERIDEVLARYRASDGLSCYLPDRLGSIRDISNDTGNLVNSTVLSAYGDVVSESGASAADRFKFTGREYDAETGLYYYRARYYDSKLGRSISEDPLGFDAGDVNLYRYVGNGPGNGTDP